MTDEPEVVEGLYGRVEVSAIGETVRMTYVSKHSQTGIVMAYFDSRSKFLSINPQVPSGAGHNDQYSQVKEIQIDAKILDWDPVSPVGENDRGQIVLLGIPKNFGRIFEFGLGLPRSYRGIIHAVEDQTQCTVVRFGNGVTEGTNGEKFNISLERFARYVRNVNTHKDRGSVVVGRINRATSHNAIAEITGVNEELPVLGRLGQIKAMTRAVSDDTPLEDDERSALMARMELESQKIAKGQSKALGKLRKGLELVTLDVLIENFTEALGGKSSKHESTWQNFFKDNAFALKQIFAAPVALYDDQVHVRFPDMKGAGGQITDFVLYNTLTRSMVVVEIKTPATELVLKKEYRGASSAKIYAPDKELSGSIAQVQAQVESARSDFDKILSQTPGASAIETRSVTGAVIVGRLDSLDHSRKQSFVRYRNGLHGVVIITFDEVLGRLLALRSMLQEDN